MFCREHFNGVALRQGLQRHPLPPSRMFFHDRIFLWQRYSVKPGPIGGAQNKILEKNEFEGLDNRKGLSSFQGSLLSVKRQFL